MIDCELFEFAGVPRTATTWIRHACEAAGLKTSGRVHEPFSGNPGKIRLSTVRDHAEWLRSYWTAIWPGQIQVEAVDGLRSACSGARHFDEFVRKYLESGWSVERMFNSYRADVVIRVEDLPWAFAEFLESVGISGRLVDEVLKIGAVDLSPVKKYRERWNPSLLERVREAEWHFAERFDYC